MTSASEIRAEYLDAFNFALSQKALSATPDSIWLLVWDNDSKCRAYSTTTDNLHFSVVRLNGKCRNFSSRFRYTNGVTDRVLKVK